MSLAASLFPPQRAGELMATQHWAIPPVIKDVLIKVALVVAVLFGMFLVINWPPLILPPLAILAGMFLKEIWEKIMS